MEKAASPVVEFDKFCPGAVGRFQQRHGRLWLFCFACRHTARMCQYIKKRGQWLIQFKFGCFGAIKLELNFNYVIITSYILIAILIAILSLNIF